MRREKQSKSSGKGAEIASSFETVSSKPTGTSPWLTPERPSVETKGLKTKQAQGKDTIQSAKKARPPGPRRLSAVTRAGRPIQIEVPERGCKMLDLPPTRIWPRPGPTSIIAIEGFFVASGYARDRQSEQLFVVELAPGKPPRTLRNTRINNPVGFNRNARPGLVAQEKGQNQVFFAIVEPNGSIHLGNAPLDDAAQGPWLEPIAQNADVRFAPALAPVNDLLAVAWTTLTTPMRTDLALVAGQGRVVKQYPIAPPAMGAAAPVFIAGIQPPVLLVVDARDGYSPLLRVPLGKDGSPGKAEIRIPISMVYDPPELTAASGSSGTFLAYTGMGGAATTAIGLVTIDPTPCAPQALVRGNAYGMLYVAAASAPRAPVFAVDAPQGPGVDVAREIQVRVIDDLGPGPMISLRGPEGEASGAALARNSAGILAIAFSSPSGEYVAWARCDDE